MYVMREGFAMPKLDTKISSLNCKNKYLAFNGIGLRNKNLLNKEIC